MECQVYTIDYFVGLFGEVGNSRKGLEMSNKLHGDLCQIPTEGMASLTYPETSTTILTIFSILRFQV